jgi:ankyrin repeat protein
MHLHAYVTWYGAHKSECSSTASYDPGQLFTGRIPFHDISPYLAAFHISEGKRPLRPDGDASVVILPSDEEWNLIDLCWRQSPAERPSMGCAAAQLHLIAESGISVPLDIDTILFQCVARGWIEDARSLLAEGADVSFSVLCPAQKRVLLEGLPSFDGNNSQRRLPATMTISSLDEKSSASNSFVSISSLHMAVHNGHVDVTELLLSQGADVNVQDSRGWTSLHWAASRGHKELVQLLLRHHALPNAVDGDGNTALHIAARASAFSIIYVLVGAESSLVHISNAKGETALHWACERGAYNAAIALLQSGASLMTATKQGTTPLHCAFASFPSTSQLGSHRTRAQLIMKLLAIDGVDVATYSDQEERTTLHLAAIYGDHALAETLLQMSVPLADPDRNGMTPFHIACLHGNVEFLNILIQHSLALEENASILANAAQNPRGVFERSDHYGWTALHWTAYCGMPQIVHTLLREQVGAYQTAVGGWTPLHCVAAGSRTKIQLDAVNTFQGTDSGWQPLMQRVVTSEGPYIEIARLLLRAQVSGDLRNVKDRQGRRPLDILHEFSNRQLIQHSEVVTVDDNLTLKGLLTPPDEEVSIMPTLLIPPLKEHRKSNPIQALWRISSGLRMRPGRTTLTSKLPPPPNPH